VVTRVSVLLIIRIIKGFVKCHKDTVHSTVQILRNDHGIHKHNKSCNMQGNSQHRKSERDITLLCNLLTQSKISRTN